MVWVGPLPRSTTLERVIARPLPVIWKLPAVSFTTWLAGHESRADWMAAVSFPPLGDRGRQIVLRVGIPPPAFSPGFQVVTRSGGSTASAMLTEASPFCAGSATLVATTWKVPA